MTRKLNRNKRAASKTGYNNKKNATAMTAAPPAAQILDGPPIKTARGSRRGTQDERKRGR